MKEKCLQRMIREECSLTAISLLIVLIWLIYWYFSIHVQIAFPKATVSYTPADFLNMVSTGVQRQLFWAVVALSSFIGFFEFIGAITGHKSFSLIHKGVFLGFAFAATFSVTRIADLYRWVAILEDKGGIPIESPTIHGFILNQLPVLVFPVCLLMWFLYLCFLIERITQSPAVE